MAKKEDKSKRLMDESSSYELRPCKTSRAAGGGGGQEKKLYLFLKYSAGRAHSLYALDVPSDNVVLPPPAAATSVTTTTVTTTTTTTDGSSSSISQTSRVIDGIQEGDRINVDSVLEFESGAWPAGMSFASVGSKLYFIGGFSGGPNLTYHTEVFVLDVNSFSSTTELRSYRDRPRQILKRGPPMTTGKIDQISFVCDNQIFLLSATDECPSSHYRVHAQFERLGEGEDDEWEVLASPNFHRSIRLSAHVQVNRIVIVSGYMPGDPWPWFYSYDLDKNEWSEFDTNGWTRVQGSIDFGFVFSSGSTFMRGGIYGVFGMSREAIPLVIRVEKQEEGEGLILSRDGMYDVVKYKLLSPRVSSTLTKLGGHKMCFIEVGNPPAGTDDPMDFNSDESHMSISIFDVDPPRFLGSAHYVSYPGRGFAIVDNAFFVCGGGRAKKG